MNRRASRALLLVLAVVLAAALPACFKHKKRPPPPPPPKVTLREHVFVRESANEDSPVVEELNKGDVIAVEKLSEKWNRIIAPDGKTGYVRRESFAVRTALFGTASFAYTAYVADKLRQVPVLDIIAVETTDRIMPGSPAGGVEGANQLGKALKADILIGVTGAGRQFVYEVVDMKNERVLASGVTRESSLIRNAVAEIADVSNHAVAPEPGSAGAAAVSPTPTPTPKPETRHPNAPLPLESPTPSAAATATPGKN